MTSTEMPRPTAIRRNGRLYVTHPHHEHTVSIGGERARKAYAVVYVSPSMMMVVGCREDRTDADALAARGPAAAGKRMVVKVLTPSEHAAEVAEDAAAIAHEDALTY